MVVPCFNEENRFPLDYWREITNQTPILWYFVDDGSTDRTLKILNTLTSKNVRVVSLDSNSGKSEAIRQGFLMAFQGREHEITTIGFIDCDGTFRLDDITRLTDLARNKPEYSMFWSSRVMLAGSQIERSNLRHYLGRIISAYIWTGLTPKIYDTQSGFKIFKNEPTLKLVMLENFKTKWFIDLEIYIRFLTHSQKALQIKEIPLEYWKEISGSKIKLSMALMIIKEVAFIRNKLKAGLKHGS